MTEHAAGAAGSAAAPAPAAAPAAESGTLLQAPYQQQFHQRWGHLDDARVRALAWLLDAPDLLDPAAPQWAGRIATLGPVSGATADWLAALERDPAALTAALGARPYTRLGLYAEKLLAFYFAAQGTLVAHGLQVRAARNDTVGEFDFLVRDGAALVHLEFASKFYLLEAGSTGAGFNGLIGPNLADTLGAKMGKIFDKQLALASHPAAQALLPQPVSRAQALVKGWLFYPAEASAPVQPPMAGITSTHCHGFWLPRGQLASLPGDCFAVLPRMAWLAPLKLSAGQGMDRHALAAALAAQQGQLDAPVMVALLRADGASLLETARGFIVPDGWRAQAAQRRSQGLLPS